jgi:hypothetical protein
VNIFRKCGAHIPTDLAARFAGPRCGSGNEEIWWRQSSQAEQVEALRREGVNAFHFYTAQSRGSLYAHLRLLDLARPRRSGLN